MKDIDQQSRNPRGSSPPFQHSEEWIDDGANGSHWVKVPEACPRQQGDPVSDSSFPEHSPESQVGAERSREDDGGNNIQPVRDGKNQ